MANPNLITVAQMKAELRKALDLLEQVDETKPVNVATYNEGDGNTIGFISEFSITVEPSLDEEQDEVNVDFNWAEA